MKIDHFAIQSTDIDKSVKWYMQFLEDAKILYQDDTWAFVKSKNIKLAFVSPNQHPPHVAVKVETKEQEVFLKEVFPDHGWKLHRDGSKSFYKKDPSGNFIEFIKYEKSEKEN